MRSGGVGGNILESLCHCVLLSLMSARHPRTLSPTSSLCPEFVQTVFSEPLNLFVNQLGIVVHYYKLECPVKKKKKWFCYIRSQGHNCQASLMCAYIYFVVCETNKPK